MTLRSAFSPVIRPLHIEQDARGATPLYGQYKYVRPQRVWFYSRFGHKLGIDFSYFVAILVINRVSIFAL